MSETSGACDLEADPPGDAESEPARGTSWWRRWPQRPGRDPFYAPPAGFESLPEGTVLRSRRVRIALIGVVPQRVTAWQLLYRSCDLHRRPEAAVTTVLVPEQAGERPPLLAFQCAIDAVTDRCFPSYSLRLGAPPLSALPQLELMIIAGALTRGWVVSIADHEGAGGAFAAPREPGYRVLDGVRAALRFEQLDLGPRTQVALWGYSGGGLASGWAAELAPEYAPELDLVGAALGAPVGDPGVMFLRLNATCYTGLLALAVAGLRPLYPGLDRVIRAHVDERGLERLALAESLTTAEAVVRFARDDFDAYTDVPLADLLAEPEILELFDELRLGRNTPECPLLVAQPVHDQIVAVADVDEMVRMYQDGGAHVSYRRDHLSEHLSLAVLAAPATFDWLRDRFAGRPLPESRTRNGASMALSPAAFSGFARIACTATKLVFGRPLTAAG